jgi:hypothetical protein
VYSNLKISTSLQKNDVVLTSYGNFKVKPEGKVFLRFVINGQSEMLPFFVVTVQSTPILQSWSKILGALSRNSYLYFISDYHIHTCPFYAKFHVQTPPIPLIIKYHYQISLYYLQILKFNRFTMNFLME